jgi:hypothetical protein
VGLNESTWLQTAPPPELVAWASQEVGAQVQPFTREGWVGLLENAGLRDIVVSIHRIDTRDETKGILRRYGWGGMLRSLWRGLLLYLRNPTYRRFVKGVQEGGITPENFDQYFGYGLYVGRKGEPPNPTSIPR